MAIVHTDGKRPKRRPSLKGGVMMDVSGGQERVRAWPKPRGKNVSPTTREQVEWFKQAQMAARYIAPQMMFDFIEMTKATPFLPRDILTMMLANRMFMYETHDGRTIYPMPVLRDVSESLDAIGAVEGYTLVRGPELWEIRPYLTPQSTVVQLDDIVLTADDASIDFINIPDDFRDLILATNIRATVGGATPRLRFNGDTGNNYAMRRQNIYGSAANYSNPYIEFSEATADASPAGLFCSSEAVISGYSNPAMCTNYNGTMLTNVNATIASFIEEQIVGTWKNASIVNEINIYASTGSFKAGSRFTLFGRGAA